jgi:ribosomal protein S18 acetylase RimI-like enzyme
MGRMDEGCRIMLADTQADNEPARRFFERAGFGSLEQHVYFSKVRPLQSHSPTCLIELIPEDSPLMNVTGHLGGGPQARRL